jgi:hypothetical protein
MALAAMAAALAWPTAPAAAADRADPPLNRLIDGAIRAGGPLFSADERAVMADKCGTAPDRWDDFEVSFMNGVLHCANGRQVDDPEVRAIMARAQPRIRARVSAVMNRPHVKAAIDRTGREAAARALRELAAQR